MGRGRKRWAGIESGGEGEEVISRYRKQLADIGSVWQGWKVEGRDRRQ